MPVGPVQTTYSFKDLVGVLNNDILGQPFQLAGGNIGNGQISIRMLTMRTEHEVGADGTVMPSYVSGNNAEVSIEVQQTSALHHALLSLYNQLQTAADSGDVSNWVGSVISFRTILDGATHNLTGVSFDKVPDKNYAAKGGMVTWVFKAAYAINQ
jgi:hypothetical protein